MERSSSSSKENSVLIPLVKDESDETGWSLLFEIRAETIKQAGEICFPGGLIEDGEDGEIAAIREASEELLLDPENIEILAPVVEKIGPYSRVIKSYAGILHNYKNTYSKDEVAKVFTLPLSWLLNYKPRKTDVTYSMDEDSSFPYELIPKGRNYPFAKPRGTYWFYETEEGVIWGITAGILENFLRILREQGFIKNN